MAIQTTANLANSIRVQYQAAYQMAARNFRVYDQFAAPVQGLSMDEAMRGSSVQYPFLSAMQPGVTAISQTADVTPQTLRDAVATITPTSRGEALQWSENLDIQAFTDYAAKRLAILGENAQESIELLAIAAALQGTWVERATTRDALDAGTAGHRASDSIFRKYHAKMLSLKVPGFVTSDGQANTWAAVMHPYVFHDISESGNVDTIGVYQDMGIHLNFELGKIGPFRLVVTPYAKSFYGAGADNGTAVATTLAAAANKLATTIVTASDVSANIAAGELWTIGTEETANTFYPTNERVKILSASTTTLTILGEGENGGLRYDHSLGEAVRNADTVYTIAFAGPSSLVKLYANNEFGEVVGPKMQGLLDQFMSVGWKFYGGYSRLTENRIMRYECTTSYEA